MADAGCMVENDMEAGLVWRKHSSFLTTWLQPLELLFCLLILGYIVMFFLIYVQPISTTFKKKFLQWICSSKSVSRAMFLQRFVALLSALIALFQWWNYGFEAALPITTPDQLDSLVWDVVAYDRRTFLCWLSCVLSLFMWCSYSKLQDNADAMIQLEEKAMYRDIINFTPPPLAAFEAQMAIYRWLVSPVFSGVENVPLDRPCLFVGNHAILGFDMPLLVHFLFKEKGLFVRGLADRLHFNLPGWGQLLSWVGAVIGSREICQMLMDTKQHVLVYPGGAREVLKKKNEDKYELKWEGRLGFALMALQHEYTIIPVSTVGTNEMAEIVMDIPLGWMLGRTDLSVPLMRPPKPSEVQRVYFHFGEPIDTSRFARDTSPENLELVRDQTKQAIRSGIEMLQEVQRNDPDRLTVRRISEQIKRMSNNVREVFASLNRPEEYSIGSVMSLVSPLRRNSESE